MEQFIIPVAFFILGLFLMAMVSGLAIEHMPAKWKYTRIEKSFMTIMVIGGAVAAVNMIAVSGGAIEKLLPAQLEFRAAASNDAKPYYSDFDRNTGKSNSESFSTIIAHRNQLIVENDIKPLYVDWRTDVYGPSFTGIYYSLIGFVAFWIWTIATTALFLCNIWHAITKDRGQRRPFDLSTAYMV